MEFEHRSLMIAWGEDREDPLHHARPAKGRAWCRSVAKRHLLSASLVTSHYTAWRREWWARPETPWWHVRPSDAGKNAAVPRRRKKEHTDTPADCFRALSSNIYSVNGSNANIESRQFAGHLQNRCSVCYHLCMLPILGCSRVSLEVVCKQGMPDVPHHLAR